MYLTYDDYEEMGGAADEGAYPRYELLARRQIDRATLGRVRGDNPVREAVKYCMKALIDAAAAEEQFGSMAAGREIASMSNDGVSVSFATGEGGARAAQARCMGIIRTWLEGETTENGVHLLYAGVDA